MKQSNIINMRIAVSYYCNLRCQHCYVPEEDRLDYSELEADQLSVSEICEFIDFLVDKFKLSKVTLTGGEALLSKVWPRTEAVLIHALHKHDLDIQLNTSGSGDIPIELLAKAAGKKLDKILLHASLDGNDRDFVDQFRGSVGAYDRAIQTITDAVNLGINVQARFTATKLNVAMVIPTYDLLSEMGVNSFMVKPMYPAGAAVINQQMLLTDEVVRQMQIDVLKNSVGNKARLDLPAPIYVKKQEFPENANVQTIQCICGFNAGYITFNGYIYPCTYIVGGSSEVANKYCLGNIKDPSFDFEKAWLDPQSYYEYRNAKEDACTTNEILHNSLGSC